MTVTQLIAKLQDLPGSQQVFVKDDGDLWKAEHVYPIHARHDGVSWLYCANPTDAGAQPACLIGIGGGE